jgi:hypothetical protein
MTERTVTLYINNDIWERLIDVYDCLSPVHVTKLFTEYPCTTVLSFHPSSVCNFLKSSVLIVRVDKSRFPPPKFSTCFFVLLPKLYVRSIKFPVVHNNTSRKRMTNFLNCVISKADFIPPLQDPKISLYFVTAFRQKKSLQIIWPPSAFLESLRLVDFFGIALMPLAARINSYRCGETTAVVFVSFFQKLGSKRVY